MLNEIQCACQVPRKNNYSRYSLNFDDVRILNAVILKSMNECQWQVGSVGEMVLDVQNIL